MPPSPYGALSAVIHSILEDVPGAEGVLDGTVQGETDFGELGYRGPLPPVDESPHR